MEPESSTMALWKSNYWICVASHSDGVWKFWPHLRFLDCRRNCDLRFLIPCWLIDSNILNISEAIIPFSEPPPSPATISTKDLWSVFWSIQMKFNLLINGLLIDSFVGKKLPLPYVFMAWCLVRHRDFHSF